MSAWLGAILALALGSIADETVWCAKAQSTAEGRIGEIDQAVVARQVEDFINHSSVAEHGAERGSVYSHYVEPNFDRLSQGLSFMVARNIIGDMIAMKQICGSPRFVIGFHVLDRLIDIGCRIITEVNESSISQSQRWRLTYVVEPHPNAEMGAPVHHSKSMHFREASLDPRPQLTFERFARDLVGIAGFAESEEYQAHAQNSDRHPDYGSYAHGARPSGRYELGLKVIFVVFALASGVILFVYALAYFRTRERDTAAVCTYAGGILVILGLLNGLMLIDSL